MKFNASFLNQNFQSKAKLSFLKITLISEKHFNELSNGFSFMDANYSTLHVLLEYARIYAVYCLCLFHRPSGHLKEYLESMEKIDQAVAFFHKSNPESIELTVLVSFQTYENVYRIVYILFQEIDTQ